MLHCIKIHLWGRASSRKHVFYPSLHAAPAHVVSRKSLQLIRLRLRDMRPIGKKSKFFFEEAKTIKILGMHCERNCEIMLTNLKKYGSIFLTASS
jgi:hypothetical protein